MTNGLKHKMKIDGYTENFTHSLPFYCNLIIKKQHFRKTENSKFHKVQKTAYLEKCVAISIQLPENQQKA